MKDIVIADKDDHDLFIPYEAPRTNRQFEEMEQKYEYLLVPNYPTTPYYLIQLKADDRIVCDYYEPVSNGTFFNPKSQPKVSCELWKGQIEIWGASKVTRVEENKVFESNVRPGHRPDYKTIYTDPGRARISCDSNTWIQELEKPFFCIQMGKVLVAIDALRRRVLTWDWKTLLIWKADGSNEQHSKDTYEKPDMPVIKGGALHLLEKSQ
jgi:hypothetical protein